MSEYTVQPVCDSCPRCGIAVRPRIDREFDRPNNRTLVEATWVCTNCYNRFRRGIVEVISHNDEEK